MADGARKAWLRARRALGLQDRPVRCGELDELAGFAQAASWRQHPRWHARLPPSRRLTRPGTCPQPSAGARVLLLQTLAPALTPRWQQQAPASSLPLLIAASGCNVTAHLDTRAAHAPHRSCSQRSSQPAAGVEVGTHARHHWSRLRSPPSAASARSNTTRVLVLVVPNTKGCSGALLSAVGAARAGDNAPQYGSAGRSAAGGLSAACTGSGKTSRCDWTTLPRA